MRGAAREIVRPAGGFLLWASIGATASLLVLFAAPRLAGGQSYAVLSDSMRGAAGVGSQVVVMPQAAESTEPGQIVAFEDPSRPGMLIQHRARSVREQEGRIHFVTAGDAGQGTERWSVAAGERVGRVVAVVPWAGHVMGRLARPAGRAATVAVTAGALTALALVMIWSGPRRRSEGRAGI